MKKYENFCRALQNLQESQKYQPPYDAVTMSGLVALYEICFELAWKAMKEALESNGVGAQKIGSPRLIIKQAYQAHMIDDEDGWLEALTARNNVAHTYNEGVAVNIINKSREKFIPLFGILAEELGDNWVSS